MKKYKLILSQGLSLVFALLLVFQLVACKKEEIPSIQEEDKMKGTLSVYYVDYNASTQNSTHSFAYTMFLDELQNIYTDLEIEATVFPTHEAFMSQTATEIAAGKGPDLFLLDFATKLNVNKMISMGTYENLSPYMKNDKSFDINNYYEPAIKAGEFNDKQYIMPFGINFTNLYTTKEKLQANNISFDSGYTYKDVLSALNKSVEKAKQDGNVIPIAWDISGRGELSIFLSAFGIPIIDYEKSSVALDKEIVLEVCDFLKEFHPFNIQPYDNLQNYLNISQNYPNIDYYICNYGYPSKNGFQSLMMEQINQESVPVFFPKYDNPNERTASVFFYGAMNSNSKNKQLAYDTLIAMTEIACDGNINWNWPVNRNTMDEWVESKIIDCTWVTQIDGNEMGITHTEEYANELKKVIDDIKYVSINNIDVIDIVNTGMMPYIEGTRDFGDCYDETVNKLTLYINE